MGDDVVFNDFLFWGGVCFLSGPLLGSFGYIKNLSDQNSTSDRGSPSVPVFQTSSSIPAVRLEIAISSPLEKIQFSSLKSVRSGVRVTTMATWRRSVSA